MKLSTALLLPTKDLDWSAPRHDNPTDILLHQLFERQAAKTPKAKAVQILAREVEECIESSPAIN